MADMTEAPANIGVDTRDTGDTGLEVTEALTAGDKVCGTPELLEGILTHLPVLDLVMATGVSKTVRHVIQASPKLQRQLFMLPSNEKAEYCHLIKLESKDLFDDYNFHLYKIASPGVIGDAALEAHLASIALSTEDWKDSSRSLQFVSISPLLRLSRDEWPLMATGGSVFHRVDLHHRAVKGAGSWEHMFLSNPPCKKARYELWWESCVDDVCDVVFKVSGLFCRDEGITFASLIDEAANTSTTVKVHTKIARNHPNYRIAASYKYPHNFDCRSVNNTLSREIAHWKKMNSKRVVRLSTHSSISLGSTVVPTEQEYDQMKADGSLRVSVLGRLI